MSTFGTMVSRIRSDIDRGTSYDTRIKQAIINALQFYKAYRFGFNQKRAEALLLQDGEFVALPVGWLEADHLRLNNGSRREPLREVTYDAIEDTREDESDRAEPEVFAIQSRELRLHPIPDRSYSLMMTFLYELPEVSISASDGATNAWMTEGEELIRKHSMADLLVSYIGGDSIAQGLALREECSSRIVPVLEIQAAREQGSGRIRAWL